jgi:phosphoribosylanthranilate isomerase
MKIKVCGMTDPDQLKAIDALGIDYAGMIFYKGSPRYAAEKLPGSTVKGNVLRLKKVGVFVNDPVEEIIKLSKEYGLDIVQLHGEESPSECEYLRRYIKVIKAFRVNNDQDIQTLVEPYHSCCDYYLFDTLCAEYGGSGKQFNWEILNNSLITKRFFLSGGIGLKDVEKIRSLKHPFLHGIDINSKVETGPGVKDMQQIKLIKQQLG